MHFTLYFPFVNAATVSNLYTAVPLPMTIDGIDSYASHYVIESDFLTGFCTQETLLSQEIINSFVGTSSFSVCMKGFSLETAQNTCNDN